MSLVPEIFILLSKSKKEPNPPIGLDEYLGKVIAEVIPFALFQGINVEFGLKASNTENPMLYIDGLSSLVTLSAPISTMPISVSVAIKPGVTIMLLASITFSTSYKLFEIFLILPFFI